MSIDLPEHLQADPATVYDDPLLAILYVADPAGGWQLSPERLAIHHDHLRQMAAIEAEAEAKIEQHRRHIAQAHDQICGIAATRALREAGANEDLLDGAVALFRRQTPLKVVKGPDGLEVVVAEPGTVAGVQFAAATWLAGASGRAWRDRSQDVAEPGEYTQRLRELWH